MVVDSSQCERKAPMLKTYVRVLSALNARQEGASAVEYAILIGLIAVVVIAGVTLLGPTISGVFSEVDSQLP